MKGEVHLVAEWRGTRRLRGEVDMRTLEGWVCVDEPEARRPNPSGFAYDPQVWEATRVKRVWIPAANVAGVEF